MENLWSPWRSEYIEGFKGKSHIEKTFIAYAYDNPAEDRENLVVARYPLCLVIMNRYPYNNGHLLIAPNREVEDLDMLEDNELAEIMTVIRDSVRVMKEIYAPHGYNVGLNIGKAGGAGLPGHLHWHIVPRWSGDTNFTATIADVKVVNESIRESREKLAEAFKKYVP